MLVFFRHYSSDCFAFVSFLNFDQAKQFRSSSPQYVRTFIPGCSALSFAVKHASPMARRCVFQFVSTETNMSDFDIFVGRPRHLDRDWVQTFHGRHHGDTSHFRHGCRLVKLPKGACFPTLFQLWCQLPKPDLQSISNDFLIGVPGRSHPDVSDPFANECACPGARGH